MSCQSFHDQWHHWSAGELPEPAARLLDQHRLQCRACGRYDQEMRALLAQLKALPAPALQAAQIERLLAGARPKGRWQWPAALVASVLLAVVLTMMLRLESLVADRAIQMVALEPRETQVMHLMVDSPRDLAGVVFQIRLPAGVELDGYPGQRELSWTGSLSEGKNGLSLPLIVQAGQGGELVARVEHAGLRKELRIRVQAAGS
jgi:hypothetical protein